MPGPQVLPGVRGGMDQASSGFRLHKKTVAGRGPEQRGMQMPKMEDGSFLATVGAKSQDAAARGRGVLRRQLLGYPSDAQVVRARGLALAAPGLGRLGPHGTRAVSPSGEDSASLPTVVRIQEQGLSCAGGNGPVTLRGHKGARAAGQGPPRQRPAQHGQGQPESWRLLKPPVGSQDAARDPQQGRALQAAKGVGGRGQMSKNSPRPQTPWPPSPAATDTEHGAAGVGRSQTQGPRDPSPDWGTRAVGQWGP